MVKKCYLCWQCISNKSRLQCAEVDQWVFSCCSGLWSGTAWQHREIVSLLWAWQSHLKKTLSCLWPWASSQLRNFKLPMTSDSLTIPRNCKLPMTWDSFNCNLVTCDLDKSETISCLSLWTAWQHCSMCDYGVHLHISAFFSVNPLCHRLPITTHSFFLLYNPRPPGSGQ